MKKIIQLFLLLFILSTLACKKEQFEPSIETLYGTWERQFDNNPIYNGLQIQLYANKAIVVSGTGRENFLDNIEKWRNIYPIRDSVFHYEDLGTDGRFYRGQFQYKIINDTTYLHCIIYNGAPGLGKNQTWKKI